MYRVKSNDIHLVDTKVIVRVFRLLSNARLQNVLNELIDIYESFCPYTQCSHLNLLTNWKV